MSVALTLPGILLAVRWYDAEVRITRLVALLSGVAVLLYFVGVLLRFLSDGLFSGPTRPDGAWAYIQTAFSLAISFTSYGLAVCSSTNLGLRRSLVAALAGFLSHLAIACLFLLVSLQLES